MSDPKVGAQVKYVDEFGVTHDALLTAIHSPKCVNVVYVSKDVNKRDSYGQQVERDSSVIHASAEGRAHGRFFYYTSIDEKVSC